MARILIPNTTLVGRLLQDLTQQIIQAQQSATRLKAITDQIGNGAALEASPEAAIPAGSGTTVAAGIAQIKTALDGLSGTVAVIDQG